MAYRKEKLEKQIMRIVSDLLLKEIKDPRIGYITVTGVELNRDLSEARVGISVIGDARDLRKSLEGINSARGYIQHRLGRTLMIRNIPKVEFYPDSSVAEGVRMVGVIEDLTGDSGDRSHNDADNSGDEE